MTGYVTVEKRSPVAITSDVRNQTKESPSVCAAGREKIWIPSPLKNGCTL